MEQASKPIYKYCIVPMCKNTTRSAPDKRFFLIARDANIRKQWCNVMKRDLISYRTTMYCCEDHFNLEEDTVNYIKHNLLKQMGVNIKLRLKKGVVPHIFHCQKENQRSPPKRMGAVKRKSLALIDEAISDTAIKSDMEMCHGPHKNYEKIDYESGSSTTSVPSISPAVLILPNTENAPGEVVNFDHLTLRVGNAKTAASYFITRLGFAPFAQRAPTDEHPVMSYAIKQNNIVLVFESAVAHCEVSEDVYAHGDFVKDVAFAVHELDELVAACASEELLAPVSEETDESGVLRYAVLRTYGDNTHTLVDRSNYTGLLLPGYQPSKEDPLTQILPDTKLTHIDHVEANMADGTLTDSVDWYERNLNMKRFWCAEYEQDVTSYSCIKSESVVSQNESVLLSFNEAAPGLLSSSSASQFVQAQGCSGVEHIALYTDDILDTMRSLVSRGAEILTWPATYYDLLRLKLRDSGVKLEESIEELQQNNILVDFNEHGYLLQAFTAHLQPRPTFFVEIIQRRSHRGFGVMNYKWLFQAAELLQIKQEEE